MVRKVTLEVELSTFFTNLYDREDDFDRDVTMVLGRRTWKANKLILILFCKKLSDQLLGRSPEESNSVTLPDGISPKSVGQVLEYLHKGRITIGGEDTIQNFHETCDSLGIRRGLEQNDDVGENVETENVAKPAKDLTKISKRTRQGNTSGRRYKLRPRRVKQV